MEIPINKRLINEDMKTRERETIIRQNVGIDVSKDDFKVAFMVQAASTRLITRGTGTFPNTREGFKLFGAWIASKRAGGLPVHLSMEATGVYYEGLAYFLHEEGHELHVLLPNLAKKYAGSPGLKSKTDRLDARVLARMGIEREFRTWRPASPGLPRLKQLSRERAALARSRTAISNLLHAFTHQGRPNAGSIQRAREHVAFIDGQVKQIEKDMTAFVKQDAALFARLKCLTSIPGVGLLTAIIVVAETHGFANVENIKQLASYSGLDVRIRESGKWKGQSRISKRGNSYIRGALYMPALARVRADKAAGAFYERVKQKKGKAMMAVVAVQGKLLGLMYAPWKKQEIYNPEALQPSGNEEHGLPLATFLSNGQKKLREQKHPATQDRLQYNGSHDAFLWLGQR